MESGLEVVTKLRERQVAVKARKMRRGGKRLILTIVATLLSLLFLVPLLWMVSTSLKTESEVFATVFQWIPPVPQWMDYPNALAYFPFWRDCLNTLVIAIPSAVGTLLSSSFVAYGFANLHWKGRESVFLVVLSHMMIPTWVTLIPLYVIYVQIHWINTFLPLIIPNFFGGAFNIFLLRQFYLRQPASLLDAARMDGASEFRIYWQVILPLTRPALAVIALFSLVGSWTDFFGPLIYLSNPHKYTLMLGLAAFQEEHLTVWPMLMAASIMVVFPLLVLFFFTQRQFTEGLHFTGLSG